MPMKIGPAATPPEFIYFDLGGVAIVDFSGTDSWLQLKAELGVTQETDEAFERIWADFEPQVVIGRDVEELLPIIRSELSLNIPNDYSLLNGFVSRFHPNPAIWPAIQLARSRRALACSPTLIPAKSQQFGWQTWHYDSSDHTASSRRLEVHLQELFGLHTAPLG